MPLFFCCAIVDRRLYRVIVDNVFAPTEVCSTGNLFSFTDFILVKSTDVDIDVNVDIHADKLFLVIL